MTGRIHSIESFGAVDGPGIRFVAFMQGCPMRCEFCHNPDTWDVHAKGQYEWTPEELLTEVNKYKNFIRRGGVTFTGGEPLMQAAFVKEAMRLIHEAGYHTALDTSGVICSEEAFSVLDYTDLVMLDIKTVDDALHKSYTGHSSANNKRWLETLVERGVKTWIRHVVVPGRTADDASLRAFAQYLRPYVELPNSPIERIEMLPYHTMGRYKYEEMGLQYPLAGVPDLTQAEIDHAREVVRSILPSVKVQ